MNQPQPIIWVVDDDETILILAQEALAEHGFDVQVFATATAASEALAASVPDFIFLDVLLPGLNGYEFCAHLRSRPGGQDVPVLMMTFLDDAEAINKAYEAGATGFVTKPINWNIEIQRVRYMLRAAETAGRLRQNEEETRQAKEAWENTFNAIRDIVTVVDRDLRILKANQTTCELLQLSLGQIIGQRACELFEKLKEPSANCPVARALQTGLPAAAEINYHHPPGTRLVSASPIRGSDGAVNQVVVVARDLSEQKRLEAQLRQVQKMEAVGTLAGGVAHEFNNLLQAVIGSAELLKMSKPSDHEDLVDIRAILDAAKRGGALTRQMLAFSRKGALWTEKIPLNLNDVIDTVQAMLTQSLARNVQVDVKLAPDLRKIKGDPEQLQQVVVNMAMNSTQAMPHGGQLTITTVNVRSRENGPVEFVALTIADTGEGMSKETTERMYEPFFTTRGVGKGTGLGLSAVFGIVKEHLADIHCESQPGVGTTFQIRFPVVPENRPPALVAAPLPAVRRPTIMVVDDEEPLRRALQRMLGRLGFDVLSAPDGPHALRAFTQQAQRPNLVILDLGLPIMSGWECLEKLRIIDASTRVLVATGYGGDDLESRARSLGAAGILMKPYDLAALGDKVRAILDAPAPAN
jgi:two-component system cell cycle sensor histidine kinase/response regulator CckA